MKRSHAFSNLPPGWTLGQSERFKDGLCGSGRSTTSIKSASGVVVPHGLLTV